MRHQQGPLAGEVVVEEVQHLRRRVRLAGAGGADHHGQAGLQAGADGLDLGFFNFFFMLR